MARSKLIYTYILCTFYHYVSAIANVFAFSLCRGWTYPENTRNPNCLLGALLREHFPGLVQLPGEGKVPEPGLNWEHYQAARLPENTHVNGFLCLSVADKVLADFWVTILFPNKKLTILYLVITVQIISLLICASIWRNCRVSIGSRRGRRRRPRRTSRKSARGYWRTRGTRCVFRPFEIGTPSKGSRRRSLTVDNFTRRGTSTWRYIP